MHDDNSVIGLTLVFKVTVVTWGALFHSASSLLLRNVRFTLSREITSRDGQISDPFKNGKKSYLGLRTGLEHGVC